MYYRNAQSALVVYDLTKPTSLTKAKRWVEELQRQASPGIVIALVGNKLDLCNESSSLSASSLSGTTITTTDEAADERDGDLLPSSSGDDDDARKVSTAEAKSYADDEGLLFFETSAKTGSNVSEVFAAIANAIPESTLKNARGGGSGGAGARQAAGGDGRAGDQSRVHLTAPNDLAAKEGCGC